jgi:hypothetical protein
VRQGAKAWIQLDWSGAVTLKRVVLHDRPNSVDQVTSGTLTFSDGSSIAVGSLANDGSGVTVAFAPRNVTWVRFTVNSVSVGTVNVGLAEFEAWGSAAVGSLATVPSPSTHATRVRTVGVTASSSTPSKADSQTATKAAHGSASWCPVTVSGNWAWARLGATTRILFYC